jgi:hypothetical protein
MSRGGIAEHHRWPAIAAHHLAALSHHEDLPQRRAATTSSAEVLMGPIVEIALSGPAIALAVQSAPLGTSRVQIVATLCC